MDGWCNAASLMWWAQHWVARTLSLSLSSGPAGQCARPCLVARLPYWLRLRLSLLARLHWSSAPAIDHSLALARQPVLSAVSLKTTSTGSIHRGRTWPSASVSSRHLTRTRQRKWSVKVRKNYMDRKSYGLWVIFSQYKKQQSEEPNFHLWESSFIDHPTYLSNYDMVRLSI